MTKKLKIFILAAAIVGGLLIRSDFSVAGVEDRSYEKQRLEIAQKILSILINTKVCSTVAACQQQQIYFVSPSDSGFQVEIYGASSKEASRQIIDECASYYLASDGKMAIDVDIFNYTKSDDLRRRFWEAAKPSMKVQFRGVK